MSLTKVQTIGIETGISFTGVTTITSLNATQGANISISSPGVALTITQSGTGGYVQVGTSSTVAVIDNSGRFLVGVASTTSDSRAVFQGSSASATGGTNVYFQRGSTPASGDKLGLFAFADVHGKVGAEISAYADATWSLGDYPGRLVFSTTPDGSSTVTERLRIDDNGNLILDSDLDTYIHHPAADTLAVTTGGSERVRIDSSGRFGIGTNSPSDPSGFGGTLDINGTTGAACYVRTNGSAINYGLIGHYGTDLYVTNNSNGPTRFFTNGGERLRITSAGLVGIGTNSPTGVLEAAGTNGIVIFRTNDATAANNAGGGFYSISSATAASRSAAVWLDADGANFGGGDYFLIQKNGNNGSTDILQYSNAAMRFGTNFASRGIYDMTLDSSGRLGIGNTNPGEMLTVGTSSAGGNLRLNSSSYGNNGMVRFYGTDGNEKMQISTGSSQGTIYTPSSINLVFEVGNTERARIDSSGRLLVGTSSSVTGGVSGYARLQVLGNSAPGTAGVLNIGSTSACTSISTDSGVGYISFSDNGAGQYAWIACSADGTSSSTSDTPGRLGFFTVPDGSGTPTERMRIGSDGRTNILDASTEGFASRSTSGASSSLNLYSGWHSATTVLNGTAVYVVRTNGNVLNTNGSYTTLSDVKLKENIADASSQWADIKGIKIRNWNFKEETGYETHRQIGPIAQELETVCPGLVSESPDRDFDGNDLGTTTKSVNQSVLYMKAVKALQEAMERIETLEASNADLLARVSALESA